MSPAYLSAAPTQQEGEDENAQVPCAPPAAGAEGTEQQHVAGHDGEEHGAQERHLFG